MQRNNLDRKISQSELKEVLVEQKQSAKTKPLQENQTDLRNISNSSAQASNIFNDFLCESEFSFASHNYPTFSMNIPETASNLNDKTGSFFREIEFPSQESKSTQGEADRKINITTTTDQTHKPNNLDHQPNKVIAKSSNKKLNIQKNNRSQVTPTENQPINLSGKTNCIFSSTSQIPMKGSNVKQAINSSLASLKQPTINHKNSEEQTIQGRQSYLDISEEFLIYGQLETLHELPRKKPKPGENKSNSQFFEDVSSGENGIINNDNCLPQQSKEKVEKVKQLKQPIKKQSNSSFTKDQLEKMHKIEDNEIPRILGQLNQQLRNTLIGEKVEAKLFKLLKEFEEARLKSFPLYELRYSKDQEQKQLQSISTVCEKQLDGSVIPILQTMLKYGKLKHFKIVATIMRCQFMALNSNKKYEVIKGRIQEAQLMLNSSDFIQSEKKEANEILELLSKYTEKIK